MPDQPEDPLHYEMKVPPEPEDAKLNQEKKDEDKGEEKEDKA